MTPTEAANLAVPNKKEIFDKIKSKRDTLRKSYENFVNAKLREINSKKDALKKSYENFVKLKSEERKAKLKEIDSIIDALRKSYENFVNAKVREREVKKKEKIYKIVILTMAIMFSIFLMIKLFL